MRISEITLSGFRCFASEQTTVALSDLTALVGTNGSGKTALLLALCRLFGTSSSMRSLRKSDFYIPPGRTIDEFDTLYLFIEVRLELPELAESPPRGTAIPECFNQMVVSNAGEDPFCRIRLDGTWTRSNTEEGDIEESISWVSTPDDEVAEEYKREMRPFERSRIHVTYIPAIREPGKQIRQVSGSILGRLLRAIEWSDDIAESVEAASASIVEAFRNEPGISTIERALQDTWTEIQDFSHLQRVQIHPLKARFDELLRQVQVMFGADDESVDVIPDSLSEGQKSLFYFALLVAAFQLEMEMLDAADDDSPFALDSVEPPSLTLFAVEEPENHLAPHYLRRICDAFLQLSECHTVQVLLSSHSPAILSRVDPTDVRYVRLDSPDIGATVRSIVLPQESDEAYKFVKEAVRAYPELYFSRLVVLGEGDSEEIVLPRVAEAYDVPVDRSFVSIVPLGGRYVNHFWRLLTDLKIPHVTLLDLDRERFGGGWGRIKYACLQLRKIGVPRDKLFTVSGKTGSRVLTTDEVKQLHDWDVSEVAIMDGWAETLEQFDVFFSSPLDLDYSMLSAFPDAYKKTAVRGPRIPDKPSAEFDERLLAAMTATLKPSHSGGNTYSAEQKELFIWYAYLFLGKGKPTTHLLALNGISDDELTGGCPEVLRRLVERVKEKLERSR